MSYNKKNAVDTVNLTSVERACSAVKEWLLFLSIGVMGQWQIEPLADVHLDTSTIIHDACHSIW